MRPKHLTRRQALQALAVAVGIPLLESFTPFHLLSSKSALGANTRKRFIGAFFGSGTYMPNNQNGDWTFGGGSLSVLENAGLRGNSLVLRGLQAIDNYDHHWSGTAGFLSCREIRPIVAGMGFEERGVGLQCGKTFDQFVADARNTSLRSISVAWEDQNYHDSGQARTVGMDYVNRLSWRTNTTPNGNVTDPMNAFSSLFAHSVDNGAVELQAKIKKKLSVLDGYKQQYGSFTKILSAADQKALAESLDSFREVERSLTSQLSVDTSCSMSYPSISGSLYDQTFKLYNRVIVRAMQCNTIASATIMLHNGIGDNRGLDNLGSLHGCAHHSNEGGAIERVKQYTRIYVGIVADLCQQLKAAGLFSDTLVLLGSNMSDGNLHGQANLPVVLLGEGSDIKFGQELNLTNDITNRESNRKIADLYMDLSQVYGLGLTSYGENNHRNTGQTMGIFT